MRRRGSAIHSRERAGEGCVASARSMTPSSVSGATGREPVPESQTAQLGSVMSFELPSTPSRSAVRAAAAAAQVIDASQCRSTGDVDNDSD